MLMPKRTKHRKHHRGRRRGLTKGHSDRLRRVRLKALSPRHHEPPDRSGRIAMTRKIKRGGKVWITIFPHLPSQEAGRDPHGFR